MFQKLHLKRLSILLCLLPGLVFALESDRSKPAHITADQFTFQQDKHLGIFTGHVLYQQGSGRLEATKVFVYTTDKQKLKKIIAIGSPAHYTTLTKAKDKPLNAYASRIEYYPMEQKVILIHNAKIHQNGNTLTGPKVEYDMAKHKVLTFPKAGKQVTILINPKNQKHEHTLHKTS